MMSRNAKRIFVFCFVGVAFVFSIAFSSKSVRADDPPPAKTPQVEMINRLIRAGWKDRELEPSAPASDGQWCRRVFLDIIGRAPTLTELRRFTDDDRGDKAKLVERLLHDPAYEQEYARNWATIWSNILIGRPKPMLVANRLLSNEEGMYRYLEESFRKNKPYDKFGFELISATGATTIGAEPKDENGHTMKFNGATNFLIDKMQGGSLQATIKTSQVFLGLQMQCLECHNHPFNDGKQQQFWEMNAFFRQTHAHRVGGTRRMVESAELKDDGFGREKDRRAKEVEGNKGEVYYQLLNGKMASAYPTFIDGRALHEVLKLASASETTDLTKANRRTELAKMVISSDLFNQAIVNRMWAQFFGYGFVNPIDDLGSHSQRSHPELLEQLAKEFAFADPQRGDSHDLKKLISWIVLSEAYGLSPNVSDKNRDDDPSAGGQPAFSHAYLRPLTPEQVYDTLTDNFIGLPQNLDQAKAIEIRRDWLRQFVVDLANDEQMETHNYNGHSQVLAMMNGDLTEAATSVAGGSMLDRFSKRPGDLSLKAKLLFLSALSREPTERERRAAQTLMDTEPNNPAVALQAVLWSLLNSSEFAINH